MAFGIEWEETQNFGLDATTTIKQLKTEQEVLDLQARAHEYSKIVLGMPVEYGIGTDIRFSQDAIIVIYCP
jgi:hypothetical protein